MNSTPLTVAVPRSSHTVGVSTPLPLSVYVHLPWCLRKCPYCDFNSHEWRGESGSQHPPENDYLDALQRDLEASVPSVWGRTVHTVFIGGGTPSLFSPRSIERLIVMLRTYLRLSADAEITLEANPGTFERERFEGFAQAGVTRLSIGVQSFDDTALAAIGRVHDADQALRAVECAAGVFKTWNLDLMYALPQQTLAMLSRDLDCALQFQPPHLSCYHLTLEPQTPFAKKPPPLPDEDLAADMQALVEARLSEAGLEPYEVSAYARPGHRCRHNLNYWRFGDYLGLGAGAHGKLSFHDRIVREVRVRHPGQYMTKPPVAETRVLSASDLPFEFMLNALRLTEGVPASDFEARTGLSLARIAKPLRAAVADGLLDADPAYLRATELGRRFLNDLQARFLAD